MNQSIKQNISFEGVERTYLIDTMQRNNIFFATFSALYLVVCEILLHTHTPTHTHRRTANCYIIYKERIRAREAWRNHDIQRDS